jgi:peptidoglycan hydrolase-like protein with peptidoglycan-binding domain
VTPGRWRSSGPAYKANKYDTKLHAAYVFHSAGGAHADSPRPLLKIGDRGEDVKVLQQALGITADGDFGPGTKAAVVALQKKNKLYADGIVGKQTWAALNIE